MAFHSSNVVDEVCVGMDDWQAGGAGKPDGQESVGVRGKNLLHLRATRVQEMKAIGIILTAIDIRPALVVARAPRRAGLTARRGLS
jgi:hypothetical protein